MAEENKEIVIVDDKTIQDKLKRIMLREMEREKDKKPHKND